MGVKIRTKCVGVAMVIDDDMSVAMIMVDVSGSPTPLWS